MIVALAVLFAAASPVQECGQCHRAEAASQAGTPMAHASESARDCSILKSHPQLAFRAGEYSYAIRREGDASIYSVTDGKQTITVPLGWAFGRGKAGQTYIFERNGSFYESRVSFYNDIGALDLTMGVAGAAPANLEEAAGRQMASGDARACFNCHSTGAVRGVALHADELRTGVQCDRCHTTALAHMAAFHGGGRTLAVMPKLSALSAEEVSNFCGDCHRTWDQISVAGPRGILNVRFQPYRLTNSRCYDAADRRIACTACHNPHQPVARDAAFYDAKCRACHSAGSAHAKVCRIAAARCASCHMPKVDLPGAHYRFTDHMIRVVRPGAPYPD